MPEVLEFDVPTVGVESSAASVEVEVEVDAPAFSDADIPEPAGFLEEIQAEEPASMTPEENGTEMAKEIIFEALEADDIIAAEIEKVSKEDIDTALEAFACDEVIPRADEPEVAEEIDQESLLELESILGPLDKSVGGSGKTAEEDKEYLPIDNDTLAELSRLLDLQEREDEKDSSD